MGRRIRILLSLAVAAMAATTFGVRLWTVHEQTSDWALLSREVPSRVQFSGRDYDCGPGAQAGNHNLDGLTLQGRTAGGGDIYAQPSTSDAGVVIAVRTDGGVHTCDLLGGP